MPHRLPFDPKRPLVAARAFTFMGKGYSPGDPFAPEGADQRLLRRQYEARAINHGEATAAESDAPAEQVTMTGPAGGRYTITAPWLAEPEVVRGKVNAEKRLAELQEAGAPLGYIAGGSAVTVEGGEGGWYAVDAPWLDEPEKVQGREAAEARQLQLHEAGEPDSYKGYTLTAGENGWYAITKDGVETDPPAELKVHGEEAAREVVAQLRAGEQPEGTALPAEWTPEPEQPEGGAGEGGDTETPAEETNQAAGAGEEPPASPDAETQPADGQPGETEESTMPKEGQPNEEGDAPNEPGTNQPNGAEVINDKVAAEPGNARSDTDGDDGESDDDGTDGGDGTTGTVGP